MRWPLIVLFILCDLVLVALALWFFAPRLQWPAASTIAAVTPGEDLDAWLAQREGVFTDLTTGTEKRILWAGEPGARTPLAIVYLPGFSATRQEIAPVPERVATALGANLFETRFAGHGRPGEALAEATVEDWATDLAEAMAIGERLGERVVLMGTSTGASVAVLAALDPDYSERIAGLVMVSPNFEVNSSQAWLLDLPFAASWVPMVAGETREWQPANEAHGRYWTTRYPSRALFPMRAVQSGARDGDLEAITIPALVFYSRYDAVVLASATETAMRRWGGPVSMHEIENAEDPSQHVIAGDILSPSATAGVVETTVDWLGAL